MLEIDLGIGVALVMLESDLGFGDWGGLGDA